MLKEKVLTNFSHIFEPKTHRRDYSSGHPEKGKRKRPIIRYRTKV